MWRWSVHYDPILQLDQLFAKVKSLCLPGMVKFKHHIELSCPPNINKVWCVYDLDLNKTWERGHLIPSLSCDLVQKVYARETFRENINIEDPGGVPFAPSILV